MNTLSICHSLTAIYYALSISYLYCCFLTPNKKIRHPYCFCCVLMLPNTILSLLIPTHFIFTTFLSLIFPLFLFKDPWIRRLSAYVTVYLIQLMAELLASNLSFAISYLITRELPSSKLNALSEDWKVILLAFLIICIGTLLISAVSPHLKNWFHYFRSATLAMIGLPLVVEMLLQSFLISLEASPHYPIYMAITVLIYMLCYIPLILGFRDMRRQELVRNKRKNQRSLMEEQLTYSQQLEKEYNRLRKWNHDISNHFISLSYLLRRQKHEESISYLNSLLDVKEEPDIFTYTSITKREDIGNEK